MANKTKKRMSRVPVYKESIKAITHIPGWALSEDTTKDKISTPQAAYRLVPLVYRSIRLRCDAISTVPVKVFNKRGTEVPWNFGISPARFLRMTEAAKLWAGAAYWLKLPNPIYPTYLDFINPFTIEQPKLRPDGSLEFTQVINGTRHATWGAENIVYIKDFLNPEDDIGAGISATKLALEDSGLLHYMSRFASKFFESGAMPLTIVAIDGTIDDQERKRVEGFFTRNMTGISNAWRVLAMRMRGTFKPEVLTPILSDMAMDKNYDTAARNIEYAFGIPEGMLRSESNRASAEEHRKSFWQDTVRPSGQATEDEVNEQLFEPMGLRAELAFEDLDIFQTEEVDRSGSLSTLTNAGIPLLMAMEILGYDLTDEQIAELKQISKVPDTEPIQDPQEAITQDLGKWERVALSRIRAGRTIRSFESDVIPADLYDGISQALQGAKTEADVKEIFGDKPTQVVDPAEQILKGMELEVKAIQADRSRSVNVTVNNYPRTLEHPQGDDD